MGKILSKEEQSELAEALCSIRQNIQWKTGKDIAHLKKRQKMGHLPLSASLSNYEKIISDIVQNDSNILYVYETRVCNFYAVRGFVQESEWLVIFGPGGVMETAFPPEDIDDYLSKRGFIFIDQIKEVLKWT
jgi:hypothetical protein